MKEQFSDIGSAIKQEVSSEAQAYTLAETEDPDLSYNQLIRPWKSRLAILYIDNQNFILDIKIIFFNCRNTT